MHWQGSCSRLPEVNDCKPNTGLLFGGEFVAFCMRENKIRVAEGVKRNDHMGGAGNSLGAIP
jgi:hypothetical protein